MEKIINGQTKTELNIKKLILIGLTLEFIGTSLIFIFFTNIYENINIIINGLMIINILTFILAIIFLKYNKKSALKYIILSLIFFFFSKESNYMLINVIVLIMQGKGMY